MKGFFEHMSLLTGNYISL